MAAYLAMRIEEGHLDYKKIVSSKRYAKYKDDIDAILIADGFDVENV